MKIAEFILAGFLGFIFAMVIFSDRVNVQNVEEEAFLYGQIGGAMQIGGSKDIICPTKAEIDAVQVRGFEPINLDTYRDLVEFCKP